MGDTLIAKPMTARGVMNRLRREGWAERAGKGKLVLFTKSEATPIVMPWHDGDIPQGALRSICRAAGWEYPPHR